MNDEQYKQKRTMLKFLILNAVYYIVVCNPSKTECNHTAGVDVILSKKGM